jgi:HTH-type transcriptional regulator/antitoxin HigA
MQLKPIRSEADYQAALQAVAPYFEHEPQAGSDEADQFEVLLLLIEHYEASHYPIAPPDPVEAIRFRMEQAGLTPKDLEPMIGRLNRVYEVLTRKRPLTLPMIRRLHAGLGIPAESLIGETSMTTTGASR